MSRDVRACTDDYFDYIFDYLSDCGVGDEYSYRELLWILWTTEFRVLVPMDENRVKNALYLREHLAEEAGLGDIDDNFCSVLDILVHLADKMAFNLDHLEEKETGLRCYFWEMIENFGFGECFDGGSDWDVEEILGVLDRWMEREYGTFGNETPYPIRHRVRNYRKLELWDQMQIYIEENYE